MCSGKIYYDLIEELETKEKKDIAIIRIEQFYPLEIDLLRNIINKYPNNAKIIWCQEEPKNMGDGALCFLIC